MIAEGQKLTLNCFHMTKKEVLQSIFSKNKSECDIMKLNFEQIKAVTTGAEIVKEYDGGVRFSRFTEEQNHLYRNRTEACYLRSLSSAGIKLAFVTDSRNLKLRVNVSPGSSRKYFSVDVFVNGKSAGSIENFSNICISETFCI